MILPAMVTLQQPSCCQSNSAGRNVQAISTSVSSGAKGTGRSGHNTRKQREALGELLAGIKSCCHSICFEALGVHFFLLGMRKAILFLLTIALLHLPSKLIHGNPFPTAICQFAVNYSDTLSLSGRTRMLI